MIVFGVALELGFGLVVEGLVIGFFDDDGGSRSVGLPECELSLLGIVVEIAFRTDSGAEVECFSFLFERELHAVSFDCAEACAIVGVVGAEGHTAVTDVDELEFVARDMEVDGVGFPFGSDEIEVIAFGVVVDVAVFPIGGVADFDEVSVAFVEGQLLCRRANASSCREEGAGEEFVELFHVDGLGRCVTVGGFRPAVGVLMWLDGKRSSMAGVDRGGSGPASTADGIFRNTKWDCCAVQGVNTLRM